MLAKFASHAYRITVMRLLMSLASDVLLIEPFNSFEWELCFCTHWCTLLIFCHCNWLGQIHTQVPCLSPCQFCKTWLCKQHLIGLCNSPQSSQITACPLNACLVTGADPALSHTAATLPFSESPPYPDICHHSSCSLQAPHQPALMQCFSGDHKHILHVCWQSDMQCTVSRC